MSFLQLKIINLAFFYDSIDNTNIYTLTKIIKNNISQILDSINGISNETSHFLIKLFSKNRKSKKITSKYYFLFDPNCNLGNLLKKYKDEDLDNFSSFSGSEILSIKENDFNKKNSEEFMFKESFNSSNILAKEKNEEDSYNSYDELKEFFNDDFKINNNDLIFTGSNEIFHSFYNSKKKMI